MRLKSLSLRIILLSAFWSLISLICVAYFMGELYKYAARDTLNELLDAHLYQVISNTNVNTNGALASSVDLGDSRFKELYSGWYWVVFPALESDGAPISSGSLADKKLVFPSDDEVLFDVEFYRDYTFNGLNNQKLIAVERKLYLDEGEKLYHVVITSNANELEAQVNDYRFVSYIILGILALASLISTILIVWLGLRPLKQVPMAFDKILNGEEEQLSGDFPSEIEPLVNSTNLLITENAKIVERSRTHVGNLAHALKTPLSVLLNEARGVKSPLANKVNEQANRMQEQIQYYLDRARISAQRENFSAQCDIAQTLERLVRVMERLNPELEFELSISPESGLIFRGEQQDLEELIGNLIENAAKFARDKITIYAELLSEGKKDIKGGQVLLQIKDDGIGLSDDEISKVLKRGERLDETKPGSGLGLSIVKDIVESYGGTIEFTRGKPSGLNVSIVLSGFIKA
jgi:signal transduction histidine kinase